MIDVHVKIHDKFSVEFKVGFVAKQGVTQNDFVVNTWIFVPNSLDITPNSYTKTHFYRDVKSNIRLITPVFLLRDIASPGAVPITHLQEAFNNLASNPTRAALSGYEYHIKMFAAIFKSALRDQTLLILSTTRPDDLQYLCSSYVSDIRTITSSYRALRHIINVPTVTPEVRDYFQFGDEFMGNIIEQTLFNLIDKLNRLFADVSPGITAMLTELINEQTAYKKKEGYLVVDAQNKANNRDLIFRHSVLKKYIESDLFLKARRRRDAMYVEQVYYSLAAGLSMIFATIVAFAVQQKYGSVTMPLFVALVVSYMLKDRIKELMRYYFAHRLGTKYFDNKTTIGIQDREIGWSKEGMDFITEDKAPHEVMEIRSRSPLLQAENRINDEKIILYRKLVRIDRRNLKVGNQYTMIGINDITRLHFARFTQKMDNPDIPLHVFDEHGNPTKVSGPKVYFINLVMQFQSDGQASYKRFRLVVSRDGIREIEELK